MRILIHVYEFAPLGGGIGNEIKHILAGFTDYKDYQFDVITSSIKNKFETEQLHSNVTLYRVPIGDKQDSLSAQKVSNMMRYLFWAYWINWKLVLKHHYDLAMMFGYPGGLVPLLFRWRIPYLVALKGIDVPGHSPTFDKWYLIYKPLTWLIWTFSSKILPISKGMQRSAENTLKTDKYQIVENGISVSDFTPATEKEKFKKFTITAGGTRLNRNKGIQHLIEGFKKLNEKYLDTELLLIGDGEYKEQLEELVKDLGLTESVNFVGKQPHDYIKENLPKCAAFCLPSYNEGMSNALLEAIAAGLPVIFTPTGGADELVSEANGYIVPKHNSEAITEALIDLYENKEKRLQQGKASRKLAESMSWEATAKKYIDIFEAWKKEE